MSVGTAFKAFFKTLFNGELSAKVDAVLDGREPAALPAPEATTKPEPTPAPEPPAPPSRSEALTLLATLQREARLIDFLQESLDGYQDAQIGAAVRDVHRESAKVIDRLFALQPVLEAEENATVQVPADFDPGEYHLVGNVSEPAGKSGTLIHHGWRATKVDVPQWTGDASVAHIVAPTEIELP